MLYVNLRLIMKATRPTFAQAAELLTAATEQVRQGKLHGQLPDREFDDKVWFSVQHATEDRPDPHSYAVKLKGRDCAAFVYVKDAYCFIESEGARGWFRTSGGAAEYRKRAQAGQNAALRNGECWLATYSEDDYTVHDRTKSDHRVVGMTSHHNAILEATSRGR